jgi:hypothetical protein
MWPVACDKTSTAVATGGGRRDAGGRPARGARPEQSDRRLAVRTGDGDHLVQDGPFLGSRGGHPRLGLGNRDFGSTTSPPR